MYKRFKKKSKSALDVFIGHIKRLEMYAPDDIERVLQRRGWRKHERWGVTNKSIWLRGSVLWRNDNPFPHHIGEVDNAEVNRMRISLLTKNGEETVYCWKDHIIRPGTWMLVLNELFAKIMPELERRNHAYYRLLKIKETIERQRKTGAIIDEHLFQ